MTTTIGIAIRCDTDIVLARQEARAIAKELGFAGSDLTLIATALSELARNIIEYAQRGEIILSRTRQGPRLGLTIIAKDHGPGISNLERAMQDGYSTGNGLGLGLPGTRRLMDEFHIESAPGLGTTVRVTKWLK